MLIHVGKEFKCSEEGCIYNARTMGELHNHMNTHSDERSFECSECQYRGKTKLQLNRYMLFNSHKIDCRDYFVIFSSLKCILKKTTS